MSKTRTESPPVQDGRILAVLSYLSVFCIIPLVLKQNCAFIEQHGKQGLVLFVGQVIAFVGHIVLGPFFLWISGMVLTGYAMVGIVKVMQRRPARLWLVSDIANKIII